MHIKLNLREKLLIVLISGLLIAFTVFGAFRIYQAKQSFTEEMNRSGQERVSLIATSLANMIMAYDYSNIESVADRIVSLQDVQQINVMNRSGRVMVSRYSTGFDPKIKNIAYNSPVVFAGENIGSEEVIFTLERLDKSIRTTYRNIIIAISLFAIFLGILIYATVSVFIVRPLLRLSKAADRLALGDFSAALPPETEDELGQMVRAFSTMRENRKKVELELNNLNASLETIVMARIAELRNSETYTNAVLENVNEGIIVIDENGTISTFNSAAEQIFGYTSEEVINQNFSMLISTDELNITGWFSAPVERRSNLCVCR